MKGTGRAIRSARRHVIAPYSELEYGRDPDCFSPDPTSDVVALQDGVEWEEGIHEWRLDYETRLSTGRDIATVLWIVVLVVAILLFVIQ